MEILDSTNNIIVVAELYQVLFYKCFGVKMLFVGSNN